MRTCLILILLLASSLQGYNLTLPADSAGKPKNSFYLELTGGYSVAAGKFASTDVMDDKSGFAANGFYIQFGGTWQGKGTVGFGFSYTYQNQPLQEGVEEVRQNGYQIKLGTSPWTNHYVLVGPAFRKDFGRFFMEIKAYGGVVLSYTNNFGMIIPIDTIPEHAQESKGPGFGFAYQFLAGGGYEVAKNLGIHLNLSFLGGMPKRTKSYYYYSYEYDEEQKIWIPVYQGGEYVIKKTISTILIGVGIVYSF